VGEAWVTGTIEKALQEKQRAACGQVAILAAIDNDAASGAAKKKKARTVGLKPPAGLDG
jgi:hypothetical protein